MLYKISEVSGAPSLIISRTDAFFVLVAALILFGFISFIIIYHLAAYDVSETPSSKIQLFYLLVAGIIILAAAGALFFL